MKNFKSNIIHDFMINNNERFANENKSKNDYSNLNRISCVFDVISKKENVADSHILKTKNGYFCNFEIIGGKTIYLPKCETMHEAIFDACLSYVLKYD